MENWSRSLFDWVLMSSSERLFDRATARFDGPDAALARLSNPDEESRQLVAEFVAALFGDLGIDDPAGACFVLQALVRQTVALTEYDGPISGILDTIAKVAFSEILVRKTVETAELSIQYGFRASQI